MNSGIYTITNLVNGKIYVGYATKLLKREGDHFSDLKYNRHDNEHLQRAYNKYGIENLVFEILEECKEEYLCALEHYWCNILDTHNRKRGYNIKPTDPNVVCRKHSKETRQKMSENKMGNKNRIGFKNSESHNKKISDANKGRKLNKETIIKMIESRKNSQAVKEGRKSTCKPIIVNIAGLYIEEFESINSFCRKYNFKAPTIINALKTGKDYLNYYTIRYKNN